MSSTRETLVPAPSTRASGNTRRFCRQGWPSPRHDSLPLDLHAVARIPLPSCSSTNPARRPSRSTRQAASRRESNPVHRLPRSDRRNERPVEILRQHVDPVVERCTKPGALGRAALSRDGQRLAVVVRRTGRWELYVMNADGSGERRIAPELDVRGTPDWSPDGRSLAVAVKQGGDPHVFIVPVDGGTPVELVEEYSLDPTWSPSGQFLVYLSADVGTTFLVKAVNADGTPHALPGYPQPRRAAPGLSGPGGCARRAERRHLLQGVLAVRPRDRPGAPTHESRSRLCDRRSSTSLGTAGRSFSIGHERSRTSSCSI